MSIFGAGTGPLMILSGTGGSLSRTRHEAVLEDLGCLRRADRIDLDRPGHPLCAAHAGTRSRSLSFLWHARGADAVAFRSTTRITGFSGQFDRVSFIIPMQARVALSRR